MNHKSFKIESLDVEILAILQLLITYIYIDILYIKCPGHFLDITTLPVLVSATGYVTESKASITVSTIVLFTKSRYALNVWSNCKWSVVGIQSIIQNICRY